MLASNQGLDALSVHTDQTKNDFLFCFNEGSAWRHFLKHSWEPASENRGWERGGKRERSGGKRGDTATVTAAVFLVAG